MSGERNNVHELRAGAASGGGGNGDRMRSVEARLTRLETVVETVLPNLATKGDIQRVEGNLPYLATKEDIQKIKVWILAGVLGGIVIAVTVALTLFRILLP